MYQLEGTAQEGARSVVASQAPSEESHESEGECMSDGGCEIKISVKTLMYLKKFVWNFSLIHESYRTSSGIFTGLVRL
jgi:hypothetical protein